MSAFRIAHLSDPHLPPDDARARLDELVSKRTLSRLAWRRKRHRHSARVLEALLADVKQQAPDHVVLTGDLTNFSTESEFASARLWLGGLGSPRDLTVSPGNHDALVGRGHAERLASLGPWLGDEAGTFPTVRRRGPLALVNICTAVATMPVSATGRLGADQLHRLDQILGELARTDLCRVLIMHHPPAAGVAKPRKSLTDAAKVRSLLARHGAEVVLHGHVHRAALSAIAGPGGPIPVLSVPSASAGGSRGFARWHMVEIDPAAPRRAVRIIARGFDPASGGFCELGRYQLSPLSSAAA